MERPAQPEFGSWTWFRWCVILGVAHPPWGSVSSSVPREDWTRPCLHPSSAETGLDGIGGPGKASWRKWNLDRSVCCVWKEED